MSVSKAGSDVAAAKYGIDLASWATTWAAEPHSRRQSSAARWAATASSPPSWTAAIQPSPSPSPAATTPSAASPRSSTSSREAASSATRTRGKTVDRGVGRERRRRRAGRCEIAHAAHEARELEPLEELLDLASGQGVAGVRDDADDVLFERHVEHHAGQPLGEPRRGFVLGEQRATLLGAHFVEVLVEVLDRAELLDERRRRLLAHPRNAGDVVGGVALEADEVGDLGGRHAEALDHAGRRVDLHVGHAAPRGHHPDVVVDDLQRVAVAGDHERAAALPLGLFGERAEDVVGLVARLHQVGDAERVHEARQVRPLPRERLGHGRPLRLVAVELVVAEGLLAGVPGHRHGGRLELGDELEEHLRKAVDGVGRETPRVWRSPRAGRSTPGRPGWSRR